MTDDPIQDKLDNCKKIVEDMNRTLSPYNNFDVEMFLKELKTNRDVAIINATNAKKKVDELFSVPNHSKEEEIIIGRCIMNMNDHRREIIVFDDLIISIESGKYCR